MARKKKGRSKKTASRRIDWARWVPAAHAGTWLLGAGALAAAWAFGVPRLSAYATMSAEPDASAVSVSMPPAPAWMQDEVREQLQLTVLHALDEDPLDRHDLVAAREALLATGWVVEVTQVRRAAADLVEVDARYVVPFGLVRDRDGDHVVDVNGRLLPRTVVQSPDASVPVITGPRFDRPDRWGEVWPGADIAAGLALMKSIATRAWRDQVASVDVSTYSTEESVSIVTDSGCRILWGRPPGERSAAEPTAAARLAYLDLLYEQSGRIDRGYTQELYIRGDVVTGR